MIFVLDAVLAGGLAPSNIAILSGGVTAVVGLFVSIQAYRGYMRNDAPQMRALAIGIGLLTTGAFLAAIAVNAVGAGDGIVLLVRGAFSVAGLTAVLYALLRQ